MGICICIYGVPGLTSSLRILFSLPTECRLLQQAVLGVDVGECLWGIMDH
jgi:hypothetical protein